MVRISIPTRDTRTKASMTRPLSRIVSMTSTSPPPDERWTAPGPSYPETVMQPHPPFGYAWSRVLVGVTRRAAPRPSGRRRPLLFLSFAPLVLLGGRKPSRAARTVLVFRRRAPARGTGALRSFVLGRRAAAWPPRLLLGFLG